MNKDDVKFIEMRRESDFAICLPVFRDAHAKY
jgi:hypothetical protein